MQTTLRDGPPENQAEKRHLAGEKILIFDLIISKERSHRVTTKTKILAWSDNPLLSSEVHFDRGVHRPSKKMDIFCTFNMSQKLSVISSINILMTLEKRKSIFFSIRPCFFGLHQHHYVDKQGATKYFLTKNSLNFSIFFE